MQKCRDTMRLVVRIKEVKGTPTDWFGMQQSLLAATMVKDTLVMLQAHLPPPHAGTGTSASSAATPARLPALLAQVVAAVTGDLALLQTVLDGVIDWPATRDESRVCVKVRLLSYMYVATCR